MRKLANLLVVIYLLSQAFDSLIRWGLDLLGLGALLYARDLGLMVATFLYCAVLLRDRSNIIRSFWLLMGMGFGVCVAICADLPPPQILFGLKVWLPFLCAFFAFESKAAVSLDRPQAWAALWCLLCAGILINSVYRFPWIGLTVQIGDASIAANREWAAAGVQRLSGFSRTSVDAASIVLLLCVYLIYSLQGSAIRVAVVLTSGLALALTTSKGAIGAFIGSVLLLPLMSLAAAGRARIKGALASIVAVIAAVGAITPFLSLAIPFPRLREGSPEAWIFGSLVSRAWDMWPRALDLVPGWQALLGRGIGGIGSPQGLFEVNLINSADNVFVYIYVTAGLLGAAVYTYLATTSSRFELGSRLGRVGYLTMFCFFVYGLTMNMIETPLFAMAIGGLLSTLSATREGRPVDHVQMQPA